MSRRRPIYLQSGQAAVHELDLKNSIDGQPRPTENVTSRVATLSIAITIIFIRRSAGTEMPPISRMLLPAFPDVRPVIAASPALLLSQRDGLLRR